MATRNAIAMLDAHTLADLRRVTAELDAEGRSLARLAKAGAVTRTIRKRYDSVSVRWGFGGMVACVRRVAEYRLPEAS